MEARPADVATPCAHYVRWSALSGYRREVTTERRSMAKPIPSQQQVEIQRVIRMGDSLFAVYHDITPLYQRGVIISAGKVLGPALQDVFAIAKRSALFGDTLHITGESGAGKRWPRMPLWSTRGGPFVAVNCAAIPRGWLSGSCSSATRCLFRCRQPCRGLHSSRSREALLFLDEVGDLDLQVQSQAAACDRNQRAAAARCQSSASRPRFTSALRPARSEAAGGAGTLSRRSVLSNRATLRSHSTACASAWKRFPT